MSETENTYPPKWPLKLLRIFVRSEYLEEIEGDMAEIFCDNAEAFGIRKAKRMYTWDVIMLARPEIVKRFYRRQSIIFSAMIKNYLRSGWRNFLKYRGYSTINVTGLCMGFAASLLLFLIVNYETSFDKFHDNSSQIYRVAEAWSGGDVSDMIVTPQTPLMDEEYPDIVHSTRFFNTEDILKAGSNYVRNSYHIVDSGFSEMFDFKVVQGDLQHALSTPDQIVLTESVVDKLFLESDPIGQTVSLVNEDKHFTVAAVVENPARNSSLQFEVLIPWQNAPEYLSLSQAGNWYNTFMTGYVQLSSGITKEEMEEKLQDFPGRHFLPDRKQNTIVLLPLVDQHFRNTSSRRIVSILGIIAGAILLISCINFINLTISQLLGRMREIGVRKVMGGRKSQLVFQFVLESLIVCLISIMLGLMITGLMLPVINDYFGFGITNEYLSNAPTALFVIAICCFTGLVSSLWPSLVLSGLSPVISIKGSVKWNKSGGYFRRGLVVVQFATSILLIIGTVVIWRQVQFMKNQELNFDANHVVAVEASQELFKDSEEAARKLILLKDELRNESVIEGVASAQAVPGNYWHNYNGFEYADSAGSKMISLRQITIDDQFFETFQMKFALGRNFNREIESDKKAVIINQAAMRQYGWIDITNKALSPGGDDDPMEVIGVVEDYYYQSLKDDIQPMIHFYSPDVSTKLVVRFKSGRVVEGLALLKERWNALDPYEPFDYRFVDEAFDELYKEQERLGTTSSTFALIAIVIACMGLFSMAAYSIRMRKKEVGIRKVLGASLQSIVLDLSSKFGLLVIMGFVLACPVAWYLMGVFLEDFAHRINLSPWIFIVSGAVVFIVSMLIVGIQSGRAASENPANALRDD